LAVTLTPEEADGLLDGLANLVSGLVGMNGEDAENDLVGLIALHIAARYIYKIYMSTTISAKADFFEWRGPILP